MDKIIYLDNAASTPVDSEVLDDILPYFKDKYYNPSSIYWPAKLIKDELNQARADVALLLGARHKEIIFTAGGSEANNLAIHGFMSSYPDNHIVTSDLEHDSVRFACEKYNNSKALVFQDGLIDLDSVKKLINDKTVLVTLMLANNEVGTVQPVSKLVDIILEVRRQRLINKNPLPIMIMSDGCQATNYLDLHVSRLKVDLLTLNASKIYGPKQSGILYKRQNVQLKAIIDGGGQEFNLRSGTENMPSIIGFSSAFKKAQTMKKQEVIRLKKIQLNFIDLIQTRIPNSIINGSLKYRLPNNIHLTFPGIDNERLLMELDNQGVMASAGSACSASSLKPSHVLSAMNISDELTRSSIRLTMGRSTEWTDMEKIVKILQNLIK